MTNAARTPILIWIVALAMIIQDLVAFILNPLTVLSAVLLALTALVAWFLVRGSRVAWVFAVFSAAAQLSAPLTTNQPVWLVVPAVGFLICLFVQPSRAFVWAEE